MEGACTGVVAAGRAPGVAAGRGAGPRRRAEGFGAAGFGAAGFGVVDSDAEAFGAEESGAAASRGAEAGCE